MYLANNNLTVKNKTTGFPSPAETYISKRLDINELIIKNVDSTFFFKYMGPTTKEVVHGSIIVIDKSVKPKLNDLVILRLQNCFKLMKFDNQDNYWGKVCWILQKL